MSAIVAAILGALATVAFTAIVGPLILAVSETKRHDFEVAQIDDDLEEWIVIHDRLLKQRWDEITEAANVAGTLEGGTIPAGRAAAQTILLYDYREQLRETKASAFGIEAEEQWTHRLVRRVRQQPFPHLETPGRAARLIEYWSEGTARNALDWNLDRILEALPDRATSRALS